MRQRERKGERVERELRREGEKERMGKREKRKGGERKGH